MYRLLYVYFKFWFDLYRANFDGGYAVFNAILTMVLVFYFSVFGVYKTVYYLILDNQYFLSPENIGAYQLIVCVLALLTCAVLKWIVKHKFLFDQETGLSEVYTVEITKKTRIINIGVAMSIFLYNFIIASYLVKSAV